MSRTSKTLKRAEEEIADLQLSIARSEAQIQFLVDALINLSAPAEALNDRLLKLQSKIETDKAQLEDSQAELTEAKSKNRDFTGPSHCFRRPIRNQRLGDTCPPTPRDPSQGGQDRLLVSSRRETP